MAYTKAASRVPVGGRGRAGLGLSALPRTFLGQGEWSMGAQEVPPAAALVPPRPTIGSLAALQRCLCPRSATLSPSQMSPLLWAHTAQSSFSALTYQGTLFSQALRETSAVSVTTRETRQAREVS